MFAKKINLNPTVNRKKMSSHHGSRKTEICSRFPAILSPSSGVVGSLVSIGGLNLPTNATDETIFVLVNGLKVSFFLSPFLLSSSGLSSNLGLELLSSPSVLLRVPSFQPGKVVITVVEKMRSEKKCKDKKLKDEFKQLASFLFTIIPSSSGATLTITNLSPNSHPVGTAGTVVTLTGTGFVEGATVTIGGITVQTTFINSTTITFLVPSTLDIGTYPITVTNPASGSNSGNSVTSTAPAVFTVTPPVPSCNFIGSPLRQFAVLGGTAVNNVGATVITALSGGNDIGVFPGTTVTGVTAGVTNPPNGTVHIADALAETAHNQAVMLYNTLGSLTPATLLGPNLGAALLFPGVYSFVAGANLNGTLTLDGGGDPGAQFVFQIPGLFGVANLGTVVLVNGAQACNVFFQVGSAATGLGSNVAGNIISNGSINITDSSTIGGRLFSLNSSVSLNTSNIAIGACTSCP